MTGVASRSSWGARAGVLAGAALALTACSSGAEDTYLERLDDAGLMRFFDDDGDAVRIAEAACTVRGNGHSSVLVIETLEERGMTQAEGRRVYEAAAEALCPDVL
jgi:hypothetical protein